MTSAILFIALLELWIKIQLPATTTSAMNTSLIFILLNLFAFSKPEPDSHIHVHLPPEAKNKTGVFREASPPSTSTKTGCGLTPSLIESSYAFFEGKSPDTGAGLSNPGTDEGGLAVATNPIG